MFRRVAISLLAGTPNLAAVTLLWLLCAAGCGPAGAGADVSDAGGDAWDVPIAEDVADDLTLDTVIRDHGHDAADSILDSVSSDSGGDALADDVATADAVQDSVLDVGDTAGADAAGDSAGADAGDDIADVVETPGCPLVDDAACNAPPVNPDPACLVGVCVAIALTDIPLCDGPWECPGQSECDLETGFCVVGRCVIEPRTCEDGNLCTADQCDPESGCRHTCVCNGCSVETGTAGESVECDDANLCTMDSCVRGQPGFCGDDGGLTCSYQWIDCDDNDQDTIDMCSPAVGCQHVKIEACLTDEDCVDEDACTVDEQCDLSAGMCVLRYVGCDDGNVCTVDGCDPVLGCTHTRIPGWECGDCEQEPWMCDDGNLCTADNCEPIGDDGNMYCTNRTVDCDDHIDCTLDWCEMKSGCRHTCNCDLCTSVTDPETSPECDDGSVCTVDVCVQIDAGVCGDSAALVCDHQPISCDDGNFCTYDSCDWATGCAHEQNPNCG